MVKSLQRRPSFDKELFRLYREFFSIWWKNLTGCLNIRGCKKRVASIRGSIRAITIFIFAKARRDTTASSSVSGTRFQRFHRNSRSVFLPSGSWQNFHDGSKEKRSGGEWRANVWRGINGRGERNGWSLLSFSIGRICLWWCNEV